MGTCYMLLLQLGANVELASDILVSYCNAVFIIANYLLNYRLQWGQHDSISILRSSLDEAPTHAANGSATPAVTAAPDEPLDPKETKKLPPLPPDAPPYFKADMSPELLSITMNDWPYSGRYPSFRAYWQGARAHLALDCCSPS